MEISNMQATLASRAPFAGWGISGN